MKFDIAFGDLGHTTKMLSNNFVPINIGFMSTYAKNYFTEIDSSAETTSTQHPVFLRCSDKERKKSDVSRRSFS